MLHLLMIIINSGHTTSSPRLPMDKLLKGKKKNLHLVSRENVIEDWRKSETFSTILHVCQNLHIN